MRIWHERGVQGCGAGTEVGLALGVELAQMWARSPDAAALILG